LFRVIDNFGFFLRKYKLHISPVAETLAWCLLPNHYHFLVRIKSASLLKEIYQKQKGKEIENESLLHAFVMQQFSNWQNSYAKAFNKVFNRKGSLFMDYLKRVEINKDFQLERAVFYIHKNPVHHGMVEKIEEWRWSSFKEYCHSQFSIVDSKEVLDWFGTSENFIQFHQQSITVKKQDL
jgi:putative transposase